MDIQHDINGSKGKFFAEDEIGKAGEMTYSQAGNDRFIIDHTEVEDRYRGKSLGLELVKAAVDYARSKNMKIMPLCPFAKKMFERHKDFSDVLW